MIIQVSDDDDTQEPIKIQQNPVLVEESDGEQQQQQQQPPPQQQLLEQPQDNTQDSTDTKMRAIIDRINAESDQEKEHVVVAKGRKSGKGKGTDHQIHQAEEEEEEIDFGQQEEEEENNSNKEHDQDVDMNHQQHQQSDPEENIPIVKRNLKKQVKQKKTKKDAPAKPINKKTTSKSKTLSKKKLSTTKSTQKQSQNTASSLQNKPTSKSSTKTTTPKSKSKTLTKPSSSSPQKPTKPKKTITKQQRPNKSVKSTKTTPVLKTFSKKSATVVSKKKPSNKTPTKQSKKSTVVSKSRKKRVVSNATDEDQDDPDEEHPILSDPDTQSSAEHTDQEEDPPVTPNKRPIIGYLACSSRDSTCTALLDHAVEQLGTYNVLVYDAYCNMNLTAYIIGKETKRGWGILQALANGVPLVSDDWLTNSISEGKWQNINLFRSDAFGQSPRAVSASLTSAKLLDGKRVKVHMQGKDATFVRKLLNKCGARVAETRVDLIINDTETVVGESVNVTKKWFADSIEAGMALDYQSYLLDNGKD